MNSALLLAIPLFLQGPTEPTPSELPEVRSTRIDRVFAHLDRTDAPGCSVGVIVDGELVHARGYGMANLEHGLALNADSIFRIGSTAKQFTAACLLLAEQDGALALDDPLLAHLPELGQTYADVTVRHLVHHQSGIRDYLTLAWLADLGDAYSEGQVLELLARQEGLDFAPGERTSYSNSGYLLMGVVLERATGKDLRTFAHERIFEPLGMRESLFYDDHTELVPRRAEGHEFDPSHGWRIGRTALDLVGDGGVFTSVRELAKWDANFYSHAVGGAALSEAQHRVGVLNDGTAIDYAAGLVVDEWRGLERVSHGGAFDGFRAELMRFPRQRLSIICLANNGMVDPTSLCRQVADLYLEEIYAEDEPERRRGPRPSAEAAGEPAEATLAAADVAGPWYVPELDAEVQLELRGDAVHYSVGATQLGPFRSAPGDVLRGPAGLSLTAERGPDGSLLELSLGAPRSKGLRLTRPLL